MFNPIRLTITLVLAAATACSSQAPSGNDAGKPYPASLPVTTQEPARPIQAPVEVTSSRLEKVFHPDMLDVDVAFFEQASGVARKSEDDRREYRIDGCDVAINLLDGQVRNMRLELADGCHADLNRFLPDYGIPNTAQLTFGNFMKAVGSNITWYADCLGNCGNAYDPSVYLEWIAPRSNLAYTVVLEGMALGGTALEEKIEQDKGEDWVVDTRFNCTEEARPYRDLWTKTYANARPHAVTIGWDVPLPECPNA